MARKRATTAKPPSGAAHAAWSEHRTLRFLPHAVLALVLVVGLVTAGDYGITFNEPTHALSGDNWWRFVSTWDHGYLPHDEQRLYYYGALFDMLGSAFARAHRAIGGHDEYLARHLLVFVTGWLGLLGTYQVGKKWLPASAALIAVVLLALTPRYYGASFANPKDIPFATAFVWAVLGLVRLLRDPSPRSAAWCGALAALCIAIRPVGIVFLPAGALACLWPLAATPPHQRWRLVAIQLSCGLVLMVALWPMLWVRPPWYVVEAALALPTNPDAPTTLFLGKVYPGSQAPGTYAAVWTAITLPLPTLVLALGGLWSLAARAPGMWRSDQRAVMWGAGLLGVWVIAPIVLPMVRHTTMYSAMRHFLFILPPLCLLAALGWHRLLSRMRERWQRLALTGIAAVAYADVALTEMRLHPYEDLYFSRLVGGIHGAAGSFEVAYYGETFREAFLWLADSAPASDRPVHVNTTGGHLTFDVPAHYAERLGMQYNTATIDYYVTPGSAAEQFPGEVVHTISREGISLAIVVKVAKLEQPRSGWVNAPWTEIPLRDGRFFVPKDRDMLFLSVDSPREQGVAFYLGYLGTARLGANAKPAMKLPLLKSPICPGEVPIDVHLRQGHNVVAIDLADVERDAGLIVHYAGDHGLTPGPPPPR